MFSRQLTYKSKEKVQKKNTIFQRKGIYIFIAWVSTSHHEIPESTRHKSLGQKKTKKHY